MTNETPPNNSNENETKITFGNKLRAAREKLGLERKDVAIQLRLPERVILMMEREKYPADLPVTFIRGYIRAYGKFLQIVEDDIEQALEAIKPKAAPTNIIPLSARNLDPVTSGHYFMQIFSYVIVLTIVGLVGVWGYTHYSQQNKLFAESTPVAPVVEANKNLTKAQVTAPAPAPQAPVVAVTPAPVENKAAPAEEQKEVKTASTNKINKAKIIPEYSEEDDSYIDDADATDRSSD